MAKLIPYRPTSYKKIYGVVDNFSNGMDTKHADSVLDDSVARDICNFNIEAGGVLSKRQGIIPLSTWKLIESALNTYYINNQIYKKGTSQFRTVDTSILKKTKILQTYNFEIGKEQVITMYANIGATNDSDTRPTLVNVIITLNNKNVLISINDLLTHLKKNDPTLDITTLKNFKCQIPKIATLNSIAYANIVFTYDIQQIVQLNDITVNLPLELYFSNKVLTFFNIGEVDISTTINASITIWNPTKDPTSGDYTEETIIQDLFNLPSFSKYKEYYVQGSLKINNLRTYIEPYNELLVENSNNFNNLRSLAGTTDAFTPTGGQPLHVFKTKTTSLFSRAWVDYKGNNIDIIILLNRLNSRLVPFQFDRLEMDTAQYITDQEKSDYLSKIFKNTLQSSIKEGDNNYSIFKIPFQKDNFLPDVNIIGRSGHQDTEYFDKIHFAYDPDDRNIFNYLIIPTNEIKNGKVVNGLESWKKAFLWYGNAEAIQLHITDFSHSDDLLGKYNTVVDTFFTPSNLNDYYLNPFLSTNNLFGPQNTPISDLVMISTYWDGKNNPGVPSFTLDNLSFEIKSKFDNKDKKPVPVQNIYKPDTDTMNYFSYNLLLLKGIYDIENITVDEVKENVDISQIEKQYFLTPFLYNALLPVVNKELKFMTGLVDKQGSSSLFVNGVNIAYKLITLEEWTRAQSAYKDPNDYITNFIVGNIVKTGSNPPTNPSANGEPSILSITPSSNRQYALVVIRAIKVPLDQIKTISDYEELMVNITPITGQDFTENIPLLLNYFANTNKSLSYKNQLMLYGQSNTIFVSDVNRPNYFPIINYTSLPIDQNIISIKPFFNDLLVQTEDHQYLWKGDTPSKMELIELNSNIGNVAMNSSVNNVNTIFALTQDGVYATKSVYNMNDRMNVQKMDVPISGGINKKKIPIDFNACASMYRNKYFLNTPSTKEIWVYHNDFKCWARMESELFDFNNLYMINNTLYGVSNIGFNIYDLNIKEYEIDNQNASYQDVDQDGTIYPIVSNYNSIKVSFGQPNHTKKFKKLDIAFEDTPQAVNVFIDMWVEGAHVVNTNQTSIVRTLNKYTGINSPSISKQDTPNIKTVPNAKYDLGITDGSKSDGDTNQMIELSIGRSGREIEFHLVHKENKPLNVKNFAFIIEFKKPRANI